MATKDTATQTQAATTTTPSLYAKILAVKAALGAIGKDGSSQVGGKSTAAKTIKYASLPNILAALKPLLAANHLDYAVTCLLNVETIPLLDKGIRVFALSFIDTDTQEISEPLTYPFRLAVNPENIKADGGTITYATRYLLGMAFSLQTEDDPDAKVNEPQPQQPAQPQQKVYTFEVCAQNLYRLHNEGNIDGAKKTYDYIVKNWGKDPAHATEIAQMQLLNL